jgi:GTP cyclohydrolase I
MIEESTPPRAISEVIRDELLESTTPFKASDNIAGFLNDNRRKLLIDELETKFEGVLDTLLIDREHDPNSRGTPRRLAKMYINELMGGRYFPGPDSTAFPNEDDGEYFKYQGMLVARAELRSMCSHHHQPVKGVCFIGILPSDKVIGLSKYTRIAQWLARRGTLQEELCQKILHEIQKATGSRDVGVHISATHGCMENRGVNAHSSLTQTTALSGQFFSDSIKSEFYNKIALQTQFSRSPL